MIDDKDKIIKELTDKLNEYEELVENLEEECEFLRSESSNGLDAEKKKQQEFEDRNRIMIKNLQNQMSMLKHENNSLKVANAALKESISWKVTKPLRDVGSIFIKG